jgi:hypothetical protein
MSKFAASTNHRYGGMLPSIARLNSEMLRDTHAQRHCCAPRQASGDKHPFHDPFLRCADKIHHPVPPAWEESESEDDENGYDADSDAGNSMCVLTSPRSCSSSVDRQSEEEASPLSFQEAYPVEQSAGGQEEIICCGSNPISRLPSIAAPIVNPLSLPRGGVADSRRFLLKKAQSHKW